MKLDKDCQVPLCKKLLENKAIQRISGFANCTSIDSSHLRFTWLILLVAAFQQYAPKLYCYYAQESQALYEHHPDCHPPFKNSVYTTATFNLGPRCVCRGHCDSTNVPFGWCMVCALGRFNPAKGGHLVLLEFGLVVNFPPGSVVLIPSGVVRHGNTPIGELETRYSFTQYVPGGVFRWVHHGFVPEWSLSDSVRKEAYGKEGERWREGIGMFSTLKSLRDDFERCFST